MNELMKYLNLGEIDEIYLELNEQIKALKLVSILFKDRVDMNNKPYLGHLTRVSSSVNDALKPAALLHDVMEDIENIKEQDLLDIGFTENTVKLVSILTKNKNEKYTDYIDSIIKAGNKNAIILKIADIIDNINPERLKTLDEKKRNYYLNKYTEPLKKLQELI